MNELQGRVAVITGAGSGFGRELARRCAAESMKLVLADIDEAALAETIAMLNGVKVIGRQCDVSKPEDLRALADAAYDEYSAVHLLFNNAGVASVGPVWTTTVEDWQWVLGVNLMGVVHGIQAFVPRMLAGGEEGHIVNTASLAGLTSVPGSSIYCVSKHGVVTMSECLKHELAIEAANIGVSVLCPAFVPTGIAQSERNRPAELSSTSHETAAYSEQLRKAVESGHLSAEDIARITLEGVVAGDFYILPHQTAKKTVAMRMNDILEGAQPRDPTAGGFSHKVKA